LAKKLGRFSLGELGTGLSVALFYALFIFYWADQKSPHQQTMLSKQKPQGAPWWLDFVGRVLGQVGAATMALLLLPASKTSPVLQSAALSWETCVAAHVFLGFSFMAIAGAHAFVYLIRYSVVPEGSWLDILPFRFGDFKSFGHDWTVPLITTVFWFALFCFIVMPLLRRRYYALFKLAHFLFVVLVPVTLIHAGSGWHLVLPGFALWALDFIVRFGRGAERVEVLSATAHTGEGVSELRFIWRGKAREHSAGMICLVNCPQISSIQWHPFSLSSSPLDAHESIHIKSTEVPGRSTWTGKLHRLLQTSPHDLILQVDGPYGAPLQFESPRVLLVAGGIGITAMQNILLFLKGRAAGTEAVESVHLVWSARTPEIFDIFKSTLESCAPGGILARSTVHPEVRLSLFCSGCAAGDIGLGAPSMGRPDLAAILQQELEQGETLVKICGPGAMVDALQKTVADLEEPLRSRCDFEELSFVF
jgi:predicted ferric reductase